MRKPTPAQTCLIIGAVAGLLLWVLGDKTSAIIIFVLEAIGWAAVYAFSGNEE